MPANDQPERFDLCCMWKTWVGHPSKRAIESDDDNGVRCGAGDPRKTDIAKLIRNLIGRRCSVETSKWFLYLF